MSICALKCHKLSNCIKDLKKHFMVLKNVHVCFAPKTNRNYTLNAKKFLCISVNHTFNVKYDRNRCRCVENRIRLLRAIFDVWTIWTTRFVKEKEKLHNLNNNHLIITAVMSQNVHFAMYLCKYIKSYFIFNSLLL